MQGDDNRPVRISASQGRRIANAVKAVEGGYQADQRRGKVVTWNPGVCRAVVTTAIPTGTFASPSASGRAQIYHKDHTGTWVESGDPVVVNNQHVLSASVAVDGTVHLAWCDGDWFLITTDCP